MIVKKAEAAYEREKCEKAVPPTVDVDLALTVDQPK